MIDSLIESWNKLIALLRDPPKYVVWMCFVLGVLFLFSLLLELPNWKGWEESSNIIRNIAIIFAVIIGLFIAFRRSIAADRQVHIVEKEYMTERFAKAVELMGHGIESIQIGGIFALEKVATEDSETYSKTVHEILCSFVRDHTLIAKTGKKQLQKTGRSAKEKEPESLTTVVQTALTVISRREKVRTEPLDLHNTNLWGGPSFYRLISKTVTCTV